jgi:hypothetical protein
VGVRVRQHGYAQAAAPHRDYVVLEYHLTNLTPDTLKPLHVGLFMDWDLPGEAGRNVVDWDATRRLQYLHDPVSARLFAGLSHLAGGQTSAYALDNQAPTGVPVRLADGFSAAEKFLTLSSGTQEAQLQATTDASQVMGARIPYLAPADSVTVAFAVLAAPSLAQLQTAATAAATRYQQVLPSRQPQLAGLALYPNPTTGRTRLELPKGVLAVQVLSGVGQLLSTINAPGGTTVLDMSAYPPGLYLVRIVAGDSTTTLRLLRRP